MKYGWNKFGLGGRTTSRLFQKNIAERVISSFGITCAFGMYIDLRNLSDWLIKCKNSKGRTAIDIM